MLLQLVSLSLLVLFCFFFKSAANQLALAMDLSKSKEQTEQQMAAAFIRAAIDIYEQRNTRPDLVNPMKFEEACNHLDELVEQYYVNVEKASQDATVVRLGALRL